MGKTACYFLIVFGAFCSTYSAEAPPVRLFHGTADIVLPTFDTSSRIPPYVELRSMLRALGEEIETAASDGLSGKINGRKIVFDRLNQNADLGFKKLPCIMRERGGQVYIRCDSASEVLSVIYGRPLIYESTTRTLYLSKSEDLFVDVRLRRIEDYWRLSLAYSKPLEKPEVTRKGNVIQVRIKAKFVVLRDDELELNDTVTKLEPFLNLQEGKARFSEFHFWLGDQVEHLVEPFSAENPVTAIQLRSTNAEQPEPVTRVSAGVLRGLDRIVIDPGHGGKDEGARGPSGLKEKDVTLALGKLLADMLSQNYEVKLTRKDDYGVSLKDRTGLANHHKADLFISIHVNAVSRSDIRGSETYYLSIDDETSAATDDWVAFENREFEFDDPALDALREDTGVDLDLEFMLWDLAQSEYLEDSFRVSEYIQEELNLLAGIRNRGVKQAPLKVLRGAQMPAVLIEVAFLSNPKEEAKLRNPYFKDQIAKSIARAIERYDQDVVQRSLRKQSNSRAAGSQ